MKRTLALLLAVLMLTSGCFAAFAMPTNSTADVQNDYDIKGTNALGLMLADELESAETDPNEPYLIRDVSVSGNTVTVTYQNAASCDVVVAAYDEDTAQMLCSDVQSVEADSLSVELTLSDLSADGVIIKAFLLGSKHQALCQDYVYLELTKAYKEFYSKDTDDFDSAKVVNLDEDKDNNFLVLADEAHRANQNDTQNTLLSADYNGSVYTFGNVTAAITGLKEGDLFYYDDGGFENVIILRVSAVTVSSNGNATVKGTPVDLEDAFSYVRIDTTTDDCDFEVDDSEMDEGVTLLDDYGAKKVPRKELDSGAGGTFSKKFQVKDGPLSGTITLSIRAAFRICLSAKLKEVSFVVSTGATLKLSVSGKMEFPKKLGSFDVSPVTGVYIGISPTFVFRISAECSVSGSCGFAIGFGYNNTSGFINKSGFNRPAFDGLNVNGKVFIGIDLKPHAYLAHEKFVKAELSGEVGFEFTGKLENEPTDNSRVMHVCVDHEIDDVEHGCIDGDIAIVFNLGAKLVFGEGTKFESNLEIDLFQLSWKIGDFYWSLATEFFGWGECPFHLVRVDYLVKSKRSGQPVKNASVDVEDCFFWQMWSDDEATAVAAEVAYVINCYNGDVVTDVKTDQYGKTHVFYPIGTFCPEVSSPNGYDTAQTDEVQITYDKKEKEYFVNGSTEQLQIEVELDDSLIEFGSYPQTKVTDAELIAALNSQPQTWNSYGYYCSDDPGCKYTFPDGTEILNGFSGKMYASNYMQYTDVEYPADSGQLYRGVRFSAYRPYVTDAPASTDPDCGSQAGDGYYINTTYWFEWEPLFWRVLDPATGLVLCSKVIDGQPYNNYGITEVVEISNPPAEMDLDMWAWHDNNGDGYDDELVGWQIYSWSNPEKTQSATNYASSSIRNWLTSDFYNAAFTTNQKDQIQFTFLSNPEYTYQINDYESRSYAAAESTNDKVFLLSWFDIQNANYGFDPSPYSWDSARYAFETSDYAKCQGAYGSWWIRSSDYRKGSALDIFAGNCMANLTYSVDGIRPAMRLDLDALFTEPAEEEKEVSVSQALQRIKKTVETSATANSAVVQQGQTYTAAADGAVAGLEYVLLVREANAVDVAAETLWYIDQKTADSDTVSFTYVPRSSGNCTVEIIGEFQPQLTTYTVRWIVDGEVTEQQIEEGATIVKPADPMKDGYTFTGWSPAVPTTMPAQDMTFTAQFKKVEMPPTGKVRSVTASDVTVQYKTSSKLAPVVTADEGVKYMVAYSGFDNSIISIDANGNVTALKKGTTTVTVTATDENGGKEECKCTVTVKYAWWQWFILIVLFGFIWY